MIFQIIIKYMKLDEDDEESADVKEALRLWVLNKTQKYNVGEIKSLTKPFHNGLVFCALIHHMRPKLLDFDSLKPENKKENLELALSIAEKYCNVARYISVDDISVLDELGMVVYIYDWYYGISDSGKHVSKKLVSWYLSFSIFIILGDYLLYILKRDFFSKRLCEKEVIVITCVKYFVF